MASHDIPRTIRSRTEEQKLQDLEKIKKYRGIEEQIYANRTQPFTLEAFHLTSKLLKLNPEYYTVWNDRRRLLISGLLSKPSSSSSASKALPTSSQTTTTTSCSAVSSSVSSTTTPRNPVPPTAGRNGTTADEAGDAGDGNGEAREDAAQRDAAALRSELGFTIPLLMEFPKCYWIWNYRLWILRLVIQRLDAGTARRIWEEELGLDSKMLTKDRRNFHAWGYRRHVVAQLESPVINGSSMVESEFEYTTRMIRVDLSNFSAWHNRSKLIPRLLEERGADEGARKTFLDEELGLIREALNVGPEDQSLWHYHRYLMLNIIESVGRSTITPSFSQEERVTYVTREIDDIKDLLEDYDDIKSIYEALMEFTVALAALEDRQPDEEERRDLRIWLEKLRSLDPMRDGRWNDLEVEYGLGRRFLGAST